jgi:RNA polymerase sigma-70 factor (ECF subfamily)
MELSDRELMGRLAGGERECLAPLMERHHRRIHRIALAYLRDADEALDCVQETFVKAFEHAARWNPAAEVGAWLTRIAVNDAIDRYRKGKRRATSSEPLGESDHDQRISSDDPSPERRVLSRQIAERVDQALKGLPETQRMVFVLRHYEERSLPEIAQILGISLGTVKSSLHRAVHRLRERLQGLTA